MRFIDGDTEHLKHKGGIKEKNIAIVVSRFNQTITSELVEGALAELKVCGINDGSVVTVRVPGAVEIPIATKALLMKQCFDGIITLGAVIKGETSHFDYVCQQANDGVGQLALESDTPISFGVLMTENLEQAQARTGGRKGHIGREAARTLLETIDVLEQVRDLTVG